jgi:hypothetical protein
VFIHQNHGAGGKNKGSIMVGMFVSLFLPPSQKPFEREFFVPARTNFSI